MIETLKITAQTLEKCVLIHNNVKIILIIIAMYFT